MITQAFKVVNQQVPLQIRARGVTRTGFDIDVISRRNAYVLSQVAAEGGWVEAGATLIELDKGTLDSDIDAARADRKAGQAEYEDIKKHFSSGGAWEAQIEAAIADLEAVRSNYESTKKLVDRGVKKPLAKLQQMAFLKAAEMRLIELENQSEDLALAASNARIKAVDARIAMLLEQLEFTNVVASQSGWLEKYHVEVGQTIKENAPVARILGLRSLIIDAPVPQTQISKIRIGDKVVRKPRTKEFETEIIDKEKVMINNQYIGSLKGLKLELDFKVDALDADIKSLKKAARQNVAPEIIKRIHQIIDTSLIQLQDDFKIYWNDYPIAKLIPGSDYLNPQIYLIIDEMIENDEKSKLNSYLQKWIYKKIETELKSLVDLKNIKETNPELRALAYHLYENNGVVKREEVSDFLKKLNQDQRKILRKIGVRFGRYHIFLFKLFKPSSVSLRILLWKSFNEKNLDLYPPTFGLNFLEQKKNTNKDFMLLCGFEKFEKFYVRIDILERLFLMIFNLTKNDKNNEIKLIPEMLNLLGCNKDNFIKLIQRMNYKTYEKENNLHFKYIPNKKMIRKKQNKKDFKDNPFGILSQLNFK